MCTLIFKRPRYLKSQINLMKQDKPHYEYILEEKGKNKISAPLIFGQCEERREIWRAPSWREARHRSRIIRPMEVYSM